ncbi:MAG: [FeFe] hydrogenase H-cluster radical SAM maturase HydE [Petrimonas sp.]|jgi:biotin synthase
MHNLTKTEIIQLLSTSGDDELALFEQSSKVKQDNVGNTVYLRGLIEYSNICGKNCLYCGIRRDNRNTHRYCLTDDDVLDAVRFAHENGFGSVAIQSGEMESDAFTRKIDFIIKESMRITNGEIGITLSCGEQSEDVYRRWFESGANRYLLRIESSSEELFYKIHPNDDRHNFTKRLNALESIKKVGFQTGTGVMIGLPFQTMEHLANDLLFMKQLNIDMCGMGPYIEHADTPLYAHKSELLPLNERLSLGFKMVALLRLLMPDINIAATTALQTIDKFGRERAIEIGANVLMPNITPKQYRDDYFLYENKPVSQLSNEDDLKYLEKQLKNIGHEIGYFKQGNSKRYKKREN